MPQIGGGHIEKVARHRRILLGHIGQADALREPHRGVDDRLGGKAMRFAVLKAENVAREMECANLSPSVGE
jgi:hypothetical protein